ncbi:MAG: ABC transporter ATP-binding protein [Terriglobia bacterium]
MFAKKREIAVPVLTFHQVSKDYVNAGEAVRALDGVSFEVEEGELVAVVGRSGCGKSTLLNLAGAMDFPTRGQVALDGVCTSSFNDAGLTLLRREKVGFVFQSFQLLDTLTAVENAELPLLIAGKHDARAQALERLRWVEMEGFGDRLPHQLSGGQQQRVAIARALAHSPRLLLADEPTGNLDNLTGGHILELTQRLNRDHRVTVIVATHSPELTAIANTVMLLRDGRIESIQHPE